MQNIPKNERNLKGTLE